MTSRSPVWNYFNKNLKDRKIQCLLCRKCIPFTSNTSNLLSHLKTWHINEYNKARAKPTSEDLVISDTDDENEDLNSNSSTKLKQTSLITHGVTAQTAGCSKNLKNVDETSR